MTAHLERSPSTATARGSTSPKPMTPVLGSTFSSQETDLVRWQDEETLTTVITTVAAAWAFFHSGPLWYLGI